MEPEVSIKVRIPDALLAMTLCEREWTVTVTDTITSESKTLTLTPNEAAATMALLVNGGFADEHNVDSNNKLDELLYNIAEKAWKGVPQNLRPIP